MALPQLAPDTANHIVVNFGAVQVGTSVGLLLQAPLIAAIGLGLLLALLLSLLKELIYDKAMRKGTPSWRDMGSNVVGIGLGIWPWVVALLLLSKN